MPLPSDPDLQLAPAAASSTALTPADVPRDPTLIERARAHLGQQLDKGDFDLGSVAAVLGTSERTLRRRFREHGTGYRALIDEVRRERALLLAHEGAHNVSAIATRVGFADVTTFTRAFRRWTGTLPSNYMLQRARARAQASGGERADP
ncbi:MAG: Transcriptional regulator, AraC family protein [Myxococcaceae bacterium]|nr:Transcriptional regulator, AraC family protein [Myxococcaceae bacterium]